MITAKSFMFVIFLFTFGEHEAENDGKTKQNKAAKKARKKNSITYENSERFFHSSWH